MNLGNELYFLHPYVSNSDLTRLLPPARVIDLTRAFAIGTLLDAMCTTPMFVDFLQLRVVGVPYPYTQDDFDLCRWMRDSWRRDRFCQDLSDLCQGQEEFYRPSVAFEYDGFAFGLDCRVKYDQWSYLLGWGADIKTTAATTMEGFLKSVSLYDYDRQRAFYMNVSYAPKDVLIGISKVKPFNIFVVKIDRKHPIFLSGSQKMNRLAHQYLLTCQP